MGRRVERDRYFLKVLTFYIFIEKLCQERGITLVVDESSIF